MDGFLLIGVERKKARKFYLSFVSFFFMFFSEEKFRENFGNKKQKIKYILMHHHNHVPSVIHAIVAFL